MQSLAALVSVTEKYGENSSGIPDITLDVALDMISENVIIVFEKKTYII